MIFFEIALDICEIRGIILASRSPWAGTFKTIPNYTVCKKETFVVTPKTARPDEKSRHKRLALIKKRYWDIILRPREEIEIDLQDALLEEEEFEQIPA